MDLLLELSSRFEEERGRYLLHDVKWTLQIHPLIKDILKGFGHDFDESGRSGRENREEGRIGVSDCGWEWRRYGGNTRTQKVIVTKATKFSLKKTSFVSYSCHFYRVETIKKLG